MLHINEKKASDAAAAVSLISNAYTWHLYFLPRLFQWSKAHTTICKRTAACERKEPWGPGAGEGWHGAASASRSSAHSIFCRALGLAAPRQPPFGQSLNAFCLQCCFPAACQKASSPEHSEPAAREMSCALRIFSSCLSVKSSCCRQG